MRKWSHASACLNLRARLKWVASFTLRPLQPRDLLDRKLSGPVLTAILDLTTKTKFSPLKWIKSGRLAQRKSVYRLIYPREYFKIHSSVLCFPFVRQWKPMGSFPADVFFFCFNLKAPDKSWKFAKSRRRVLIPTLTCSWNKNEGLVVTAERKLKISDLEFTNKLRIWRALNCCTCFVLTSKAYSRRCQSHWPWQNCRCTEQLEFSLHVDCRNLPSVWARVFLEILTAAQLVSWSVVTSPVPFSPGND